ncbi:hypothetical protein AcV7_006444 [Taiwanofungus camphoratus]|nr:hypothetical protein AcV7_006444 [Antrodia cinnamomea]
MRQLFRSPTDTAVFFVYSEHRTVRTQACISLRLHGAPAYLVLSRMGNACRPLAVATHSVSWQLQAMLLWHRSIIDPEALAGSRRPWCQARPPNDSGNQTFCARTWSAVAG